MRAVGMAMALLCSTSASAAPGVWMGQALTVNLKPTAKVAPLLWLDLHERQTGGTFAAIVRPGVGVKLIPGLTLWAGYAWIPTVADGVQHEHRIWQQVIGQTNPGVVKLMGRVRFEQRLLEGADNVGLRVRAFGRLGAPLSGPVGVSVWDEVFVRANDNGGAAAGFDQNRVFAGVYHQAPGLRVEVGYLNLVVGTDPTVHHLAAAYVFLSPKTRKQKGGDAAPPK